MHTIQKMHRLILLEGEQELPDGSSATRYRFTHALYQYHAYDQLLSKRKALLHRRAGETLERIYSGEHAQVAAALATHFERGRDLSRAVTYLMQAGDNAVSRYASAEAVSYYSRGLELTQKLPDAEKLEKHIVLLGKRAAAHMALGRLQESFADYLALREVSQAAGDQQQECRALIGLVVVANFIRDLSSMERYGRRQSRSPRGSEIQALASRSHK